MNSHAQTLQDFVLLNVIIPGQILVNATELCAMLLKLEIVPFSTVSVKGARLMSINRATQLEAHGEYLGILRVCIP